MLNQEHQSDAKREINFQGKGNHSIEIQGITIRKTRMEKDITIKIINMMETEIVMEVTVEIQTTRRNTNVTRIRNVKPMSVLYMEGTSNCHLGGLLGCITSRNAHLSLCL